MILTIVLLAGFLLSLFTIPLYRWLGRYATWLLGAAVAVLFGWLLLQAPAIAGGAVLEVAYPWVPQLDVAFALRLDGLSLLFALLIIGQGVLIVLYSGAYMAGKPTLPRFQAYILLFMSAMFGVVLADDLVTLFAFWELTSVASFLLIGFKYEQEGARYSALKALLITGGGGLAMVAGAILLGMAGGTFQISALLTQNELLTSHALYPALLLLILLGAFTKSAQFPFHIWLPDAMAAPTPASAYLHSATMVKAGIYLLARLHPALGGTDLWHYAVGLVGLITMLLGAYLAFNRNDLKALLAYTTISALGWQVALLGIGSSLALKAAMVAIVAHALYKAALFLLVGIVEHETGTRDLRQLSGLLRKLPVTAALTGAAAFSMAGLPPLLGFLAKETLFETALTATPAVLPSLLVTAAAVAAAILAVGYTFLFLAGVFLGPDREEFAAVHEPGLGMLLPPAVLSTLSLLLALPPFRTWMAQGVAAAAGTAYGAPVSVSLALWHGFNLPLLLTVVAIAGGILLYLGRDPIRRLQGGRLARPRLDVLYDGSLAALNRLAGGLADLLQTGGLDDYLKMILGALLVLVFYALFANGDATRLQPDVGQLPVYEVAAALVMIIATVAVAVTPSRLGAVAALGTVGFFMTLFFVIYSGPDLALTQLMVETLLVILLLLVFYFLPRFFADRSTRLQRLRDVAIAAGVGTLVTILTLLVIIQEAPIVGATPVVSEFYLRESVPSAFGANVVNVILVDFRALDTLGEMTVLVIAALGAFALLKLRLKENQDSEE